MLTTASIASCTVGRIGIGRRATAGKLSITGSQPTLEFGFHREHYDGCDRDPDGASDDRSDDGKDPDASPVPGPAS